jgi:hypothetical protein
MMLVLRHHLGRAVLVLEAVLAFASVVSAQAAGQSGAANAKIAAPTPDLSGTWMQRKYSISFNPNPPLQPWAETKFKAVKSGWGPNESVNPKDPAVNNCFPPGVPRILLFGYPMEIIQIPGRVIMLFEYDHYVRQIYTDGREHNKDLPPLWMGDSIGKWEGDTLVVDAIGFNDKTWLDQVGHPHSDALHVVERIRRVDHNTLQDDLTIDDPKAYTKPWTGQELFMLEPDWNIMEFICEDALNKANTEPSK